MKAQFVAKTAVETLKAKDKEAEAKPCMCTVSVKVSAQKSVGPKHVLEYSVFHAMSW